MNIRVSDWIADYIANYGIKNVHGLMGGGAAGLNDGFIKNKKIKYICYHHEQSAGHAAVGESKLTNELSVVNPTTGCGGTNCITSVLNAWQDSVPVLFLSGNVTKKTCTAYINKKKNIKLRCYGIQEHNIINTVKDITKFSKFVENPNHVPEIFEQAITTALEPRMGPVWIDVPSDIQHALISNSKFKPIKKNKIKNNFINITKIKKFLHQSSRPLVIAGAGIKQSNCSEEFTKFIKKNNIPFVTSYSAVDVATKLQNFNIGVIGIKGTRSGNFAVANADLLIILGCRLASSALGYDVKNFSKFSKKIMIDCDISELKKNNIDIDLKIKSDLKSFFKKIL